MSSWFTTKKVEGSHTLSEKLAEIRSAHNIDLDLLSDKTKISKKYLVYLEEGRLDKLPAEIYVKGFLKKLAEFYETDAKNFLRLYEQEDVIRKNIDKSKYPPFNLNKSPTFIITQRTILAAVGLVLAAIFIFFISYQLQYIVKGPELVIESPQDETTTEQAEVLVAGTVKDPNAKVFINDSAVSLKDGKISEIVNLSPGLNIIKILAENKFNKSSLATRKIILKQTANN